MSVDRSQGTQTILHATTVAVDGQGVLITGPSGAGKSSLALRLISLGAVLVSDDRTIVTSRGQSLVATAPETIRGKIEARGVGILQVPVEDQCDLKLVIDLSVTTVERLPEPQTRTILERDLPCLPGTDHVHFPDAILLYLRQSINQGR